MTKLFILYSLIFLLLEGVRRTNYSGSVQYFEGSEKAETLYSVSQKSMPF